MSSPDAGERSHLATIRRYYEGCNTVNIELMRSTFDADVVHYFVDHAPVSGAVTLASYWAKIGPRTRARWSVDHFLAGGDEAVVEWSMRWMPAHAQRPEVLRGTEWFRFVEGRIAESSR